MFFIKAFFFHQVLFTIGGRFRHRASLQASAPGIVPFPGTRSRLRPILPGNPDVRKVLRDCFRNYIFYLRPPLNYPSSLGIDLRAVTTVNHAL